MKKITMIFILMLAVVGMAKAQVIEDFEHIQLNVMLGGEADNSSMRVVPNPDPEGNTSSHVVKFERSQHGIPWGGFWSILPEPLDLTEYKYVYVDVWKPRISPVRFKVEGGETANLEIGSMYPQTKTEEWETLVFDFSEKDGHWNVIAFMPDFEDPLTLEEDIVIYFDNIRVGGPPEDDENGDKFATGAKDDIGYVVENFEHILLNWFAAGANAYMHVVPNPDPEGNTSTHVVEFMRGHDGDPWAGFWSVMPEPVDLSENKYFYVDVWKPRISPILFKLEGGEGPNVELNSMEPQTKVEEWETMVFDFSEVDGLWEVIVFFPDFEDPLTLEEDIIIYFDNIRLGGPPDDDDPDPEDQENLVRNGDFTGPRVDPGWVSIHEITNTTGTEFWHVQFNQSLTQDQIDAIEVGETYELTFYAKAESGKEVAVFFGQDGGDWVNLLDPEGEGVSIIDFTTEEQSFSLEFEAGTFDEMKLGFEGGKDNLNYSIGHVSILKKVEEGEDAGGNIINNGHFGAADFEDTWFVWMADWLGVTASALINDWFLWYADWEGITVDLTIDEGWANIHNIENTPGSEFWHVQFNQQLTASQIDALITGGDYTLTFVAKAEDNKDVAVFFGQEGGAWKNLLDPEVEGDNIINLTAEEQSFSFEFIGEQFDVMKLGFEGGLSDVGYSISNVQILKEEDDDPEGFEVTFNVDMGPAEGFDPAEHSVFITGNFAGWAEPGTEGSYELTMVSKGKEAVEVFYETFGDGLPGDWENVVISGPDDFPGWEYTTTGAAFGGVLESTTADDGYMKLDSDAHGAPGAPEEVDLITPSIDLTYAESDVIFSLEHLARTFGAAEIYIYISVDDFDSQTLLYEWSGAEQHDVNTDDGDWPDPNAVYSEFDITDIAAGESNVRIKFKWVGDWDYWWLIDDVKIMAVMGEAPEETIYTVTVQGVEAGEIQYKYFSDAFGEGWDGGEWDGDPNRTADITDDTVINDAWGDLVTSIVDAEVSESILSLFPNPATSNITVESSVMINEVKVFDITGRMVMQANVNGNHQTLDVSTLRGGLYIMQVHTTEGVEGRRFHVAR